MTPTTNEPLANFRAAVGSLLAGNVPNGTRPEHCGAYGHVLTELETAHGYGGTAAVRNVWETLTRADRSIATVMAGDTPEKGGTSACPPLPLYAQSVYEHAEPCATWLDSYVEYALQAAPMAPRSFHELAGLFAISVAIARRLMLPASIGNIFPNIFALWIGDPAIYSKTSALKALTRLINDSGLRHFLLPERLTPEALMLQYSLSIPQTLENWQPEAKEQWVKERAYASQRAWVLDEAARLFSSLKVDYNVGLLGLLLQLYDCPDEKSEETTGRGRIVVTNNYLSFFGVATPHGMTEHFTNRDLWENGLWSRFALIMPTEIPPWQFLGEHIPIPSYVLNRFRAVFDLFPSRDAELVEVENQKQRFIRVTGSYEPSRAVLDPRVRIAWEAYSKATRYDMLITGNIDKALYGSYGRFGTHAIKVAMLLATMDCDSLPVKVEVRHWVRAQQIVETWREGLHRIWTDGIQTDEARNTDRLLNRIREFNGECVLPRDVYRPLNLKAADAQAMFEELAKSGQAEEVPGVGKNGRAVTYWRALPETQKASYTKPEVS